MNFGFFGCFFAGLGATLGVLVGFVLGKLLLFAVRFVIFEYTGRSLDGNG